jgi:hypothetical protein
MSIGRDTSDACSLFRALHRSRLPEVSHLFDKLVFVPLFAASMDLGPSFFRDPVQLAVALTGSCRAAGSSALR